MSGKVQVQQHQTLKFKDMNIFQKQFIAYILLLSTTYLNAQTEIVNQFVQQPNLVSASIGFLVKELESGKVIADYQSGICRNPASVTKLITTASAFEMLSDTFRFKTYLGYDGSITDSVLHGDLYIIGGGDPTLESKHNPLPNNFYINAIESIQKKGIKEVKGKIIGDATLFAEDGAPFLWLVEDIGSSYSPTPSALTAHDNLLQFSLISDSSGINLTSLKPFTAIFQPNIEMSQTGKEIGWRVTKTDFSWQPSIRGNLPIGTKRVIKTEIPEPSIFLTDSLQRLMNLVGISVDTTVGSSRQSGKKFNGEIIYTQNSAPLHEIAKITNHQSNNLYAENIFLFLSLQNEKCTIGTNGNSHIAITNYWKGKGIDTKFLFQVDGSGMSMKNGISPKHIVDILEYMKNKSSYSKVFIESIPVAGKKGTVANFMKNTPLSGRAHVKSGSMERVQNYAGYIQHKEKWYAFCIMVSNFGGQRATVIKQISTLLNDIMNSL